MPDPAAVQLLALDVDGVLTDGSIYLDDEGNETKRFNIRDGFGVRLWQRLGFQVAVVTGRPGKALRHRAAELGIRQVVQGCSDKAAALRGILTEAGLSLAQAAFLGDDWPDLCVMREVGYPMAVADADPLVRAAAAFTTAARGGQGAVREAVEHLIAAKGLMPRARALYDPTHADSAPPSTPSPRG
jgi:3-deoxy-D-manno-octulosonate 8-phosphate phosphatase (KDO 8-P phosphatase)